MQKIWNSANDLLNIALVVGLPLAVLALWIPRALFLLAESVGVDIMLWASACILLIVGVCMGRATQLIFFTPRRPI